MESHGEPNLSSSSVDTPGRVGGPPLLLTDHTEVLAEAGHGAEEIATLVATESRRLFGRGVRVQSVEGAMNGY